MAEGEVWSRREGEGRKGRALWDDGVKQAVSYDGAVHPQTPGLFGKEGIYLPDGWHLRSMANGPNKPLFSFAVIAGACSGSRLVRQPRGLLQQGIGSSRRGVRRASGSSGCDLFI